VISDTELIFSLHEHELKPDVDSALYEKEVSETLQNLKIYGLLKAYLLKGFKGERVNRYAVLWVFENAEVIEENFGTVDNPKWPEQWLYYENQVLARYLTCHPDKIHFTAYAIKNAADYNCNNLEIGV
jgi:hypothetical protein